MSNHVSDGSCIAFKTALEEPCKQSRDLVALTDISPKDKAWDKHRAKADVVSNYYAGALTGCFNGEVGSFVATVLTN